jgi:hypothetical protein
MVRSRENHPRQAFPDIAEAIKMQQLARRSLSTDVETRRTAIHELVASGLQPQQIENLIAGESKGLKKPVPPKRGMEIREIITEEHVRFGFVQEPNR